jgi:type IV pilus assembly protein PilM
MTTAKSAWGVEVGSFAVKAVRLERQGSGVKVTDFAIIPHSKVLSAPDVDADEIVRISLGQFVSQKAVDKTRVAISVPGNVAFSAFTRLPPHEPKQTPNLVRFEAEQQIPFPINEVEWDYKTFVSEDSPEVEVGIFALQRSVLDDRLSLYGELGIEPDLVTISPLALYNAVAHDLDLKENSKPLVILDIATRHSDLVVTEGGSCWFRRLPVGGHNFTAAIAEAFKISYSKAEKLKQEGATGKYAKQVMQAMRPVFTELLESVQRSLEYYRTTASLDTVLGVGSTFRIPGLRKFLGTQLQKDVHRLDEFRQIRVEGPEAADFATNTVNLWTAYGLALQQLGGADIEVNLAPVEVLRRQMWSAKRGWFVAAASVAFLTGAAMFGRYFVDSAGLRIDKESASSDIQSVEGAHRRFKSRLDDILAKATGGSFANSILSLDDYRAVWPELVADVSDAVATGNDPDMIAGGLDSIHKVPAGIRKIAMLEDFGGAYRVEGTGNSAKRLVDVSLQVAYSNDQRDYLNTTVCAWLRDNAERAGAPFLILKDSVSYNPSMVETVTVAEDGSSKSSGPAGGKSAGKGGSNSPNRGNGRGRGGQESGGGKIEGAGGKTAQQGEKVEAPGGGMLFGGSTSGAGFAGAEQQTGSGNDYDTGRDQGSSSGDRRSETALGNLDEIAPIPPEPPVFEPGSTYYRGFVTFTIEILDPAQNTAEGED